MMSTGSDSRPGALTTWRVGLCIVVLAALALRLYGIDWDDGADLHPDELFIAKIVLIDRIQWDWPPDLATLLDPARSGLNPRSADPVTGNFREFAYGALPLWVTDAVAWLMSLVTATNWNAMDHAYLVGRFLSAVLSALTIIPIALLGRAVGGPPVGLLAALFAALAPMSIQLAHFFTTDSWLTFFVAWSLWAAVAAATHGQAWRFALAGGAFGLAMASKGSVFTLAIPIAVAIAIVAVRSYAAAKPGQIIRVGIRNSAWAAIAAAVAFFAFEPYALLRPAVYFQSLRTQADIVSGSFDVPFTRVYAGTTPFLYQIEQLVRWGYGPSAGILALIGIGFLAVAAVRQGSIAALILTAWALSYSAVLIVADVKFLRYLEPLAPTLAVGAALALVTLSRSFRKRGWSLPARALAPAALLAAVAWTGAFVSIYAHENPRVAATKWIYAAVPPGSNLTAEYWDDALPRSLSFAFSPAVYGYGSVLLDLYRDAPPAEASDAIYEGITAADYIVQSSQRVESAMEAAPWRYPVQGRFFTLLADERLGYRRVAEFSRAPAIGNVMIDDRAADESFVNYDHPRVAIYERESLISRQTYDDLMSWALQRPWRPFRAPPEPTLLLDTPVGENPAVNDARWSAPVTGSTVGAAAVWLLLLLALAAAGIPLARGAFASFPDAGWGLARTLALVVAAYPVWLGASLQLFRFRAAWAIASLVIVTLVGWLILERGSLPRRRITLPFGGQRAWLHAEAAFWLVFLLFLAFRLVTPDGWHPFWGGEKPMEFALINAIGRGAYFPPYDPWFADGYVNYYYYGFYLVAFLNKITGIPAEIAFNLALPTMMGLLASGAFSIAAALARALTRSPRLGLLGGWLAVVAICLIGNLTTLRVLLDGVPVGYDPFILWVWNGSRAIAGAITEFPYFTGLYADLHAHVVALPLTVVAIALSFSLATSAWPRETSPPRVRGFRAATALRLLLLALTLGALSATNAWDVPVYAALALAALFMATSSVRPVSRRIGWFTGTSLAVALGAWLLYLPFHSHFVPLFSQLALVRDPTDLLQFLSHLGGLIVICVAGLCVLLLPREQRSPGPTIWPVAALAAAAIGLVALDRSASPTMRTAGALLVCAALAAGPLAAAWFRLSRCGAAWSASRVLGGFAIVAGGGLGVLAILAQRPVLGLMLALGASAVAGWLVLPRASERFVCLLLAAAFLTAGGTEIVVVADDLINTPAYRMNTIFKFYNQIWVLLALSASSLVALMAREALARAPRRDLAARTRLRPAWSRAGLALAALVLVGSLTYPLTATAPRLAERFDPGSRAGTLDALDWMQQGTVPVIGSPQASQIAFRGDASAIAWLLENVEGTPVVAEASIGPYRCNGSRISAATGLPTIIGWERHQQQQRYPDALPARVNDVRTLYTSENVTEKAGILYRYNVEYVVVGELDRLYPLANNECTPTGSAAGIAAFETMVGETLEVAHAEAGTTIYRVLPLAAGA